MKNRRIPSFSVPSLSILALTRAAKCEERLLYSQAELEAIFALYNFSLSIKITRHNVMLVYLVHDSENRLSYLVGILKLQFFMNCLI